MCQGSAGCATRKLVVLIWFHQYIQFRILLQLCNKNPIVIKYYRFMVYKSCKEMVELIC